MSVEEEEEIPFMSPAKYLQNGFYVGTGSNLGVNNVRIPFIEHPSLLWLWPSNKIEFIHVLE
jgi:hypothetical protein